MKGNTIIRRYITSTHIQHINTNNITSSAYNLMISLALCLLLCSNVWANAGSDNKCGMFLHQLHQYNSNSYVSTGSIPDDRSCYTKQFENSNGHDILTLHVCNYILILPHLSDSRLFICFQMYTDTSSGYTWQDVVNDRSKWDAFEPWVNWYVHQRR